jgi:hypothetical protein
MALAAGIFRQYDIRGVVGDDLTGSAASAIGGAFAAYLTRHGVRRPVAVGRDNRPSGAALRDALVGALTSSGVDVIDIGVVPTPLLYWSLNHLDVGAGIQITGGRTTRPNTMASRSVSAPNRYTAKEYRSSIASRLPARFQSVAARYATRP